MHGKEIYPAECFLIKPRKSAGTFPYFVCDVDVAVPSAGGEGDV
jgi:hypothetical protein